MNEDMSQVMGNIKPLQFSPMALFMLVFLSLKFLNFFLVDLDENENDLLGANGTEVHAPNDSKSFYPPSYAPINSKPQQPLPPGHLTVHRAQGGGNLNVVLKGI